MEPKYQLTNVRFKKRCLTQLIQEYETNDGLIFQRLNIHLSPSLSSSHNVSNTYEVIYNNPSANLLRASGCSADGFKVSIPLTATVDDLFIEISSMIHAPKWAITNVRITKINFKIM
jgi:hypothetical protein